MATHEHEKWQIRESAKGGRYCAACGTRLIDPIPTWDGSTSTTEGTTMNKNHPAEPPHGSVVLAHGWEGTAFQRFYSDDFWHGTTGRVTSWADLCDESRTLIVVHDPSQVGTRATSQTGIGGDRS